MAHTKSAKKRIRQNATRRMANRYYAKTMRNAVRKIRATKEKKAAAKELPVVISLIDKISKRKQIHNNNASNLKSKLTKMVNKL
ncbi:MAG: small subunit ribosomal protein S20 [Chitinophagales bacterium]|jgi:small subunit ribosomal protein S20